MRFFKTFIFAVVVLLLSSLGLNAEVDYNIELTEAEKQWIAEEHIVQVRVSFFPPFHFNKNKLEGLSVDILTKILTENNIKYKLVSNGDYSWSEALELIKEHKKFDLFLTASNTEERKRFLVFSDDYLKLPGLFSLEKIIHL